MHRFSQLFTEQVVHLQVANGKCTFCVLLSLHSQNRELPRYEPTVRHSIHDDLQPTAWAAIGLGGDETMETEKQLRDFPIAVFTYQ